MVSSVNNNLSTYFTNLVSSIMETERQPLTRLQTQRDTLNVQKAVYQDTRNKIDGLLDAITALSSSSPFNAFKLGRTAAVSNVATGYSVLTASASSSAALGIYDVSVTDIAVAQRRVSASQSSADQALNKTGDLYVGGTGVNAASIVSGTESDWVGSLSVAGTIDEDRAELGTGRYIVETEQTDGQWRFRLVDENGDAVAVGPSQTAGWQDFTPGSSFDTERGLVLNFRETGEAGSTLVDYTAMGRHIEVVAEDSLVDIANKINSSRQPGEYTVTASVVGTQMILTNDETGDENRMVYSSGFSSLLGFSANLSNTAEDLQTGRKASFTVNGLPGTFTSQSNTVSDVIYGVTLNLASDAEGRSARVTVNSSTTAGREAVNTFVEKFNDLLTYLEGKMAITKVSDKTYTRGALANDSAFSDLRSNLFSAFMQQTATGTFGSLLEVGLTINDSLRAEVSDSSKLEAAMTENMPALVEVMDTVMSNLTSQLERFTGTGGYITQSINTFDTQIVELGGSITDLTTRLNDREVSLVQQFGEMQAQLLTLTYQQQMMASINSVNYSS